MKPFCPSTPASLAAAVGQHNPRTLRTLDGAVVPDQEHGDFDNVQTFAADLPLLPASYTFTFPRERDKEARIARKAGMNVHKYTAGTATCPLYGLTVTK